ncbi:ferritin-like domain-containing protein [Bartonella australis]|uniref:ferritin-like domain-containing protein n=1 Tax=Bartonella australis TaxID=388640 RepID=UPI001FCC0D24|nr:ferritin-like domain-containing protein [Bartonella australis]
MHSFLIENWGYTNLTKLERKESVEEMGHVDKIVKRIIFLEECPNLRTPFAIASREKSRRNFRI